MPQDLTLRTEGDLEAVVLAESYDLLSSIVGPYMYEVVGPPTEQQAAFESREMQALFYIRVHEFLAASPSVPAVESAPASVSLFTGGSWLAEKYPEEANASGLDRAYRAASDWFGKNHRIVFWAPSVGRHLRLEAPMQTLIAMRSNMEKHHLMRLEREVKRLRSRCAQSGCTLTVAQAVAVREEFEEHLTGMLEYHVTEVAEHVARCFLALYRLVRDRYARNPTNNLADISPPKSISDDVFRFMYASTIVGLARWTEPRILSSTPDTARWFKGEYPQHAEWDVIDREGGDT